jgi:indole-3-glycerol phosphate synthase
MILDDIVEKKKVRLAAAKQAVSPKQMEERGRAAMSRPVISFYEALKKPGLSIIGEFKQASPSLGNIDSKIDLEERIAQYNEAVDAISCLTEEDYFHGNTDYFQYIRGISRLPMLRKDFIFDEYQIYEARAIGADAILLIVAILSPERLKELYDLATDLGMDVLVETHDEAEMQVAINAGVKIIGINNRNLKDFSITLETAKRLSAMAPADRVLISESGVMGTEDVRYLAGCAGVDGLLIGRAFMEAEQPKELALAWKQAFCEARK